VVANWDEETLPGLRAALQADVEVEPLSLEDLFVEFHS